MRPSGLIRRSAQSTSACPAVASSSHSCAFKVKRFHEPCGSQSKHMIHSYPTHSAPQIPEATGCSSPAELIVRMLHMDSTQNLGRPLPLSPWKGPFIEPRHTHPAMGFHPGFLGRPANLPPRLGCGLQARVPMMGILDATSTVAHYAPSGSLTADDPEMSASFPSHWEEPAQTS